MKGWAVITGVVATALVVGHVAVPGIGQAAGAVGPVGESAVAAETPGSSLLPEDGTSLPTDSRAIRIRIQPDGDAVWRVQYRMRLDGENATASFESVRSRVEANPLQFTGPFSRMMQQAADVAANDTGRSMAVRNVSVRARKLPNQFGVVTYRFEWAGFARTSGGTVHVGDALEGLFLASERSSLLVEWPAGYEPSTVSPDPDDERQRAVVWRGPTEFATDEPRVVLTGGTPLPVDATGIVAGSVLLLVVGVAGWQVWMRREGDATGIPSPTRVTGSSTESGQQGPDASAEGQAEAAGDATTAATDESDQTATADAEGDQTATAADEADSTAPADAAADDATATAGDTGASGSDAGAGDDDATHEESADEEETTAPPAELLSDEERVLQLLEDNGGRMKQQDVVATMDWSETKTSQVVREMREDDQIEVFRLGRENVLSLPGEMDV